MENKYSDRLHNAMIEAAVCDYWEKVIADTDWSKNGEHSFSKRHMAKIKAVIRKQKLKATQRKIIRACSKAAVAGLYGLRRGEVLGLSRDCIDFDKKVFHVKRQLDSRYSSDHSKLFAPLKELASDRVLPITAETLPYFERHLQYLDGRRAVTPPPPGDLLFYRENGEIYNQTHISRGFNEFLKHCGLPHLRFHDLRHA